MPILSVESAGVIKRHKKSGIRDFRELLNASSSSSLVFCRYPLTLKIN